MGIQSVRAGAFARVFGMGSKSLGAIALLVGALLFGACNNNDSQRTVSAGGFLAPFPNPIPGMRRLLDKIDILGPIDPNQLRTEVAQRQATPRVLQPLDEGTLLLYEGQSRSVLSVSLCPDPDDCLPVGDNDNSTNVALHYNSAGLSDAQRAPQSSLSQAVPPIRLANGWILAYDANTRNIIGFRPQEPVDTVDEAGNPVRVGYRVPPRDLLGGIDPENANFGQGNGLVLSVVISGEEMLAEVDVNVITRMFEIEPNRILIFFGQNLPRIHLLEVEVVQELRNWDLETPSNPGNPRHDEILTDVLRGEFLFFPDDPLNPASPRSAAFLEFETIRRLTQNRVVRVDTFQPVIIPQDPPGALLYDATTFNFMKVVAARNQAGQLVGGVPTTAISSAVFLETLRASAGVTNPDGPFTMGGAVFPPGRRQIWIFEEETNNMLCFNYDILNPNDLRVLDVCVPSVNFTAAFDPKGRDTTVGSAELELVFARGDVTSNRMAFDRGSDRILSISYSTSRVAVVARRADIIAATRDALAEILLLTPLDVDNSRFFDAQSVSVVELPLNYALYPISF